MGFDITKLGDAGAPPINVSRIGNGSDVPENIKNYTRDEVGTSWLDFTSLGLFIMLFSYFNVVKQYGIYQSVFLSSAWCLLVSFSFLASGFSKNISPLFLYGTMMLISGIMVYQNKKKGFNG